MGYYKGKGKRAKFGIGAFLVGVLTQDKKIKTIAKIGTGLTDNQFRQMKKLADKHSANQKPKYYDVPKDLTPDVWMHPEIVVEIAADEITKSPLHTAGHALRFPRLIGFRPDKDWEQATTLEEFEQIE
jgi:DNA ligase-1